MIALFIAVVMNINTITIIEELFHENAIREAIIAAASNENAVIEYPAVRAALNDLNLPIGWDGWRLDWSMSGFCSFILLTIGWILTATAATLGAPFWFDLLNKMMVIRSTVKPHEKSPEEGSEDRQPRSRRKVVMRTSPAYGPAAHSPPDDEDVDGCSLDFQWGSPTRDEQLPPSTGGVG